VYAVGQGKMHRILLSFVHSESNSYGLSIINVQEVSLFLNIFSEKSLDNNFFLCYTN